MTIQIVEVLDRSKQGVTLPFLCRGDDGLLYYVKGRHAGRRSQICELVAGELAKSLGLPIPPFELVNVPPALIGLQSRPDISELGSGVCFGSRKKQVVELNRQHLHLISQSQRLDVLAFDWWVQNNDRTLTDHGGNPNLFWDAEHASLVMLDHNQAFDPLFSPYEFAKSHAFSESWFLLQNDFEVRQQFEGRFANAIQDIGAIYAKVPGEWFYVDDDETVSTNVNLDQMTNCLQRFNEEQFWTQQ